MWVSVATTLTIGGREIGPGRPCYLVAEIGNNHNGSVEAAKALIRAARDAGAGAVKFQTFRASDIVSPHVPADAYPGWNVADQFDRWIDFVETLELPYEAYDELLHEARALGLEFISTPASFKALDFLVEKRIDAIKIASMDVNNLPFLKRVGETKLPVILSTGMSTLDEIAEAVDCLDQSRLAILHCVSSYPLKYEDANLRNIVTLQERFPLPVGFSNHALGHDLDIAAVACGAALIEKHFTLDRRNPKPAEHHFSMEPDEFREMVERVRMIERALGARTRTLGAEELQNRALARRSIAVNRDVAVGAVLTAQDLVLIRPGTGIEPKHLAGVVGKQLTRSVKAFEPLAWTDLVEARA